MTPNFLTVEIGGMVYPIIEESLLIESILGQVVDTCEFQIYDLNRKFNIRTMDDISITRDDGVKLFAGLVSYIVGTVEGPTRYWDISCQDYTILLDRTLVRQNYQADFRYDGLVGDRAMIASAFERDVLGPGGGSGASEISARTHVEQGLTVLSQQVFKYSTLREVVSQLAQYVGHEFYVDYDRELHYYYKEERYSPYMLTDGDVAVSRVTGRPSGFDIHYRGVSWKRDGTRLVNTFALFGDRLLSDPLVFVMSSDGRLQYDLNYETIRLNFTLSAEPRQQTIRVDTNSGVNRMLASSVHDGSSSNPSLFVATGTFVVDGVQLGDILVNTTDGSWGRIEGRTQQTLFAPLREGTTNLWNPGDVASVPIWSPQVVSNNVFTEGAGANVYHDAAGKTLTFRTAPPAGRYAIRLRFTHNFLAGQVDTDGISVERYRRVFARRVIASDVNSSSGITQKLRHLKEQYAFALQVVTVTVDESSFPSRARRFQAGEWVTFRNAVLGVDDTPLEKELLVHRVTTRLAGARMLEYELELRDWETDII